MDECCCFMLLDLLTLHVDFGNSKDERNRRNHYPFCREAPVILYILLSFFHSNHVKAFHWMAFDGEGFIYNS